MKDHSRRLNLPTVLLAVLYFAAGAAGHQSGAAVWSPSGIALAGCLLSGYAVWPGILVGAFLVGVTTSGSVVSSLGIALGNTLEALAGAYLVNRFVKGASQPFLRPQHVSRFAGLAGITCTAIGASFGATSLALTGSASWSSYGIAWLTWWFGDAASNLVAAPLIVLWTRNRRVRWNRKQLLEALALIVSLGLVGALVFGGTLPKGHENYPLEFLCFPILLWPAFRFGQREAATASFFLAVIAISGTLHGFGPFASESRSEWLLLLQAYMGVAAITALAVAAVVSERRTVDRRRTAARAVTQILAESCAIREAAPRALQAIGESLAWQAAALWRVDEETRVLRCVRTWHAKDIDVPQFEAESQRRTFEPGVGLPGRVWAASRPAWISDVAKDENFPRAAIAVAEGLHGAFGFPVVLEGRVLGVLEFFSEQIQAPDEDLLKMMANLGSQIGQFIERRRAEQALLESEEKYRIIAETATDALITIDEHSKILFANPAIEKIFGYRPQELLGEQITLLMPEYLRHVHRASLQRYIETGQRHISWEAVELPGLHRSGRQIPLEISFGECREAGKHIFTGIVRDISERKRAEAALRESELRYSALAEAVPEVLFTNLPDGSHDYSNQRFYEYTGMSPGSAQGFGWTAALHPDDLERCTAEWTVARREEKPFEIEYRLRSSDGAYRWFLSRSVPLRDEQGRIVKWFGACTDINDKRMVEEQRGELLRREQDARAAAESANRMKDEFLATVSHELRTPLTAILGWSRMIRSGMLDASEQEQALDTIERNATVQAKLIEDILDVSRIIAGKLRLDVRPLALSDTIDAAVDALGPAAAAKGITVRRLIDSSAGQVTGDPNRLQQVVWNLASNAIKFTPRGGVIEIGLLPVASHVEIYVRDTGEGIRREFLPHIFEPFRQADSSSSRAHGGLGLGLAIVRHIVEAHGGTIRAESAGLGNGATFTVTLPKAAVAGSSRTEVPDRSRKLEGKCPSIHGMQVLIVDDEPDALAFLSAVLSACHAAVRTARSTAEALDMLWSSKPDLLIADIGMPGEDGYVLIRRLRSREAEEQASRLPAIALTAYAGAADRTMALESGYEVHLAKPIDPAELVRTVAEVVGARGRNDR